MKNIFPIIISIVLLSCSTSKYVTKENKKLPADLISFLKNFEDAANQHQTETIIMLLDPEYRDIQLNGFHKGNTHSFLNELFCGKLANKDGFTCLDFKSVKGLKFVKAENTKEGYTVYYKVSDNENKIICSWLVTVKRSNQKTIYGIYGALG